MLQAPNRKTFLPALANCMEVGGATSSVVSSGITHLPTIQRLATSYMCVTIMVNFKMVCMYRCKASKGATRKQHFHTNSHNQETVQIFPTVMKAAEITGRKIFPSGKK